MTTLPPPQALEQKILLPHQYQNHDAYIAYTLVHSAANAAKDCVHNLVSAQVLGYLLLYPVSDEASRALVSEIISCNEESKSDVNQALYDLGTFYINNFICIFKKCKGSTPVCSEQPSRPSFGGLEEMIKEDLKEQPHDHCTAKRQALIRDGFRCMVTGHLDVTSAKQFPQLREEGTPGNSTDCCHIFPTSFGDFRANESDRKKDLVSNAWTILGRFGYGGIREELQGDKIHRLENILTLSHTIHEQMDDLSLWFEEVEGKENLYRIKLSSGLSHRFLRIPTEVQFVARQGIPLPSPVYLRIHAACCKIAHLSGATEYIDRVQRDMEESKVLAKDGESADVLTYALNRLGSQA